MILLASLFVLLIVLAIAGFFVANERLQRVQLEQDKAGLEFQIKQLQKQQRSSDEIISRMQSRQSIGTRAVGGMGGAIGDTPPDPGVPTVGIPVAPGAQPVPVK